MARTRTVVKVESAQKRWLSKKEAMAYLGCGEDLLDRLRDEDEIKFSRFGSRMIWYDLASLDKFVLKHKVN